MRCGDSKLEDKKNSENHSGTYIDIIYERYITS